MTTTAGFSRFLVIGLLVISGLTLEGCGQMRKLAGVDKSSPDEFRVVDKPPLVMPPDYTLRPRPAGESEPQQLSPATQVIGALFPGHTKLPPASSPGEQALVQSLGGSRASANIRSDLGSSADTVVVEKGLLLRDVLDAGVISGAPDTSRIDRVGSHPIDTSGSGN